jgi:hypothetical protein
MLKKTGLLNCDELPDIYQKTPSLIVPNYVWQICIKAYPREILRVLEVLSVCLLFQFGAAVIAWITFPANKKIQCFTIMWINIFKKS